MTTGLVGYLLEPGHVGLFYGEHVHSLCEVTANRFSGIRSSCKFFGLSNLIDTLS